MPLLQVTAFVAVLLCLVVGTSGFKSRTVFLRNDSSSNDTDAPLDCIVGDWSNWTHPSPQTRSRSRTLTPPEKGGARCPETTSETEICDNSSCYDCILGDWEDWSECSQTCGIGGTQGRTRPLEEGDVGCPTSDSQACNEFECPVDCVVGNWSEWSACPVSCGGGSKERTRVLTQPSHGGVECPESSEETECNTLECPVDCVIGQWSEWGYCNHTCGSEGTRLRTRNLTLPQYGGSVCPSFYLDSETCGDIIMGTWGDWEACSQTCGGGGLRLRRRTLRQQPAGEENCHAEATDSESCNDEHECPVDCVIGDWIDWTECSTTCGFAGTKSRTRMITQAEYGGACSSDTTHESLGCNKVACPEHCVVGEWDDWSECSQTCGTGGTQFRTRPMTQPEHGGVACPDTSSDSQTCNESPCPVDCGVGQWTAWSNCSKTCEGGVQSRSRTLTEAEHGGVSCSMDASESKGCNNVSCLPEPPDPVDCIVGDWSDWSHPSPNTRSRNRTLWQPETGGALCPNTLSETEVCDDQGCYECTFDDWKDWGGCSQSCGTGGTRERTRDLVEGNPLCPTTSDSEACNEEVNCPVDCIVSDWDEWEGCSLTCGGGKQSRNRTLTEPVFGGDACPRESSQLQHCNEQPCPVDCVIGDWSDWEDCNYICGSEGARNRTRSLTRARHGGAKCPESTTDTEPCGEVVLGHWTEWSSCSKTCGTGGTRTRIRSVGQDTDTELNCSNLPQEDEEVCNEVECPVDCLVSDWTDWSHCSLSCGGGNQSRTRVFTQPEHGGRECPDETSQSQACNEDECAVDCVVGDWTHWSTCSESCGTEGTQSRSRTVTAEPEHGGTPCPETLSDSQPCNVVECPVDCVLGNWSDWGACSRTCGGGQETKTRTITEATHGGLTCTTSQISDSQTCNDFECPVDCIPGDWSDWECATGGDRHRHRNLTHPEYGGAACPKFGSEERDGGCPVDCVVGEWGNWGVCSNIKDQGCREFRERPLVQPQSGGAACPEPVESQNCSDC